MLLPKERIRYIASINHEGKLVLVATDVTGTLWYTVKQDGFEKSFLATPEDQRTGWEDWRALALPDDAEDPSVLAREAAELTLADDPDTYLIRSRYRSRHLSAVAPVQLVSALGHVYVFRQSTANTLLVDRFVLDGMSNALVRKLEVRFKRSGQRYASDAATSAGAPFEDTLDYRDMDGRSFYEPTTELCLVDGLQDGWFRAVLVPTNEHEVHRWHIFAYDEEIGRVVLTSLRASKEGLFDIRDHAVFEPRSPEDPTLAPRMVPGVIRRELDLDGATVTNGLAATRYDLQRGSGGEDETLLRTDTRLLLAVPTDQGTAALSFAIAADGTLSQIDEEPAHRLLRADLQELLLPVGLLEDVEPMGDRTPAPEGTITGMTVATVAEGAEDRVVIYSPEAATLADRELVEIQGTRSYDGIYVVDKVTADSFEITTQWVEEEMGAWQKREDESLGLYFDGMITAYEKAGDSKLAVTVLGHGLAQGDQVQISGSSSIDGRYPAVKLDDGQFVIDRRWTPAEAVSLQVRSLKQHGLSLDGVDDHVELPAACMPGGDALTVGFWAKGGASLPKDACVLSAVDAEGQRLLRIAVPDENGQVVFEHGRHGKQPERIEKAAEPAEYRDRWTHWAFVRNATDRQMQIYRNGVLWHESQAQGQNKSQGQNTNKGQGLGNDPSFAAAARLVLGASAEQSPEATPEETIAGCYQGEVADLRIWSRALSQQELQRGLRAELTGKELALQGYWRLGAVVEGEERKVVDFSLHGRDGIVRGGACVGAVSLPRVLSDGMPAVKYANPELLAVSEQSSYIEELEFRVQTDAPVDLAYLDDVDGQSGKIFQMSCWGTSGRADQARVPIAMAQDPFEEVGDGWFRATGRFTVPGGVGMVRCFEIGEIRGDWSALEVRRHRIRMVSNAVTETRHTDALVLPVLADDHADLEETLAALRLKEQQEALLRAEEATLEQTFDALARMEESKLRAEHLRGHVRALEQQEKLLASEHERQQSNPLNYYCHLDSLAAGQRAQAVQRNQSVAVELRDSADLPSQRWRFVAAGDGAYYIHNAGASDGLRVQVVGDQPAVLALQPSADVPAQQWKLVATADGAYAMYNVGIGDGDSVQALKRGNLWELAVKPGGQNQQNQWRLVSTGQPSNDVIARALADWQAVREELAQARAELAVLEAAVVADEPQRVAWRTRLHQVVAELGQVRSEMSELSQAFLAGLRADLQGPQAMPEVARDGRGLSTRGAFLGFVRAASRLSALETCEGNVQLTYFDELGRMRATSYDATADSRNTTFEQWLPEAQRACVRVGERHGAVHLASPIDLAPAWTIEAWFFYPLPPRTWNVLASDEEGSEQTIVIYDGRYPGIRSQGRFLGNGASLTDMAGLASGWHHLTAVKQGSGQDGAIAFYVDGKKLGGDIAPRASSLILDGQDDYVTLPPASIPTGAEISVGFWARCQGTGEGTVIEAVDAAGMRVLAIDMPGNAVTFACGNDGQSSDSIDRPVRQGADQDAWTHWTFTKNAATGTMTIYRNGRPWHGETGKTRLLPAAANVTIGRRASEAQGRFQGGIAALCIWNRVLSEAEIQAHLAGKVTGVTQGMTGCWMFENGAQDSAAGNHGTVHGAPAHETMLAGGHGQIACLGNTPGLPRARSTAMPMVRRAMRFGGAGEHVELPAVDIDPSQGLTVEAWVRFDSLEGDARLVDLGVDLGDEPAADNICLGNDGKRNDTLSLRIFHGDTEAGHLDAPGALQTGQWMHLACTLDADGQGTIYKNGAPIQSGAVPLPVQVARAASYIGKSNEPAHGTFAGQMAELRVWQVARTEAEIQASMYDRLIGREPGLAAYWPLDDIRVDQDAGNVIDLAGAHAGTARGVEVADAGDLPIDGLGVSALEDQSFGKLAEVRVWRIALADEEIAVNGKTLLTGNEPGLVAYYPMSEGQGTEVRDVCGYNAPGTLTRRIVSADETLPAEERIRRVPDESMWWPCTAVIGNLGHRVLRFDGQSHLAVPPLTIDSSNGLTVEAWVRYHGFQPGGQIIDLGNGPGADNILLGNLDETDTLRFEIVRDGQAASLAAPGALVIGQWLHLAATVDAGGNAVLYRNGEVVQEGTLPLPANLERTESYVGRSSGDAGGHLDGRLADLRVWTRARTQAEIRMTMYERLTGMEPGLSGYWPLDALAPAASGSEVADLAPGSHHGLVNGATLVEDNTLPLGGDALVSAEYQRADVDPATQKTYFLMRRLFASPTPQGAWILPDKRIEALEMSWVGNAQFAPTLLGYIEGAPPVPSENLTESSDYSGATSVELETSEDVEFRWNRSEEFGIGGSFQLFLGIETETLGGLGVMAKLTDVRVGLQASLDFTLQTMHETNISSQSSLRMTDRLELRGAPEANPKFPHLGRRFVPKNVGYALVASGLGDVYITRLARTRRMLAYQIRPVEGVAPQVNTITFLMNPAYTMQGSLDGMTGSRATSDRYSKHVPALRAQYGARYPASFYRLDEARALKQEIERKDVQREAYYAQFAIQPGFEELSLPDTDAGSGMEIDMGDPPSDWPGPMKEAWQRGDEEPMEEWPDEWQEKWNKERQKRLKEQSSEQQEQQEGSADAAKAKIETLFEKVKSINGALSYASWQKKMEELLIAAGKRNIVNTYVWDADGGLRAEAQSFASTAEHTIGGSFNLDASLGLEGAVGIGPAKVELTALATANLNQTVSKSDSRSRGIDLHVDLSGVESIGITDHDDRPILPGEKVDRYRFMSFYLEGSTDNYSDFFRRVVDPDWLRSNDEEAQLLREAMGKPNKTWRVLHRVTYVERPAALGVDRDIRQVAQDGPAQSLMQYIVRIYARQNTLEAKLNDILNQLAAKNK